MPAIKKLVDEVGPDMEITFMHTKGYPEKRKKQEDFTELEHMNDIDCNEYAYADQSALEQTPTSFSPLEGSQCMLRIGKQWISTRVDYAL